MIEKIFNVKAPFWKSMGNVFDLFILNLLWTVCSIPIITIGPATTAAYYVLIQRARNEQTEMHKDFFRSFKENFKQGTLLGVGLTLVGGFFATDIYLCRINGTGIFTFFMFFFGIFFLVWAMTTLYAFPLLAKFERKSGEILIWAFTLSIKNLGTTIVMLLVFVAGMYFCYRLPGLLFIMFGLCFQYCATIFASIFKPYLPKIWRPEDEDADMYNFNPTPQEEQIPNEMDFMMDEAAMYGYTPEELERLLHED